MSLYSRLDRLATDVARLDRQLTAVSNSPQAQRTSIEAGTMDVNDEDGNLVSTIGLQEDGSGATRFFDGPVPPVPAGFTALADGPVIQGTWDGTFVDGQQATYDLAYLEVAATLVDDDSRVSFATITAKEGASASVVANQTGTWAVAVRSVSQAGKKSEFFSAGTVEVKITDLSGAIEAVQDSANGKNRVHYEMRPPTPEDPGIFDDTWFVGQVGRPSDIVEATNLWLGSALSKDRSAIASTTTGSTTVQTETGLKVTTGPTPAGAYSLVYTNTAYRAPVEPGKTYSWRIPIKNHGPSPFPVSLLTWINGTSTGDTSASGSFTLAPGEQRDVVIENFVAKPDAKDIRFSLHYGASATKPVEGSTFEMLDEITLTATTTAQGKFNGDTPDGETANESHYRWTGTPHASTSEKYLPALDIGDSDNWNIIEQYRHDGTGWVKVELSHHVFSTIDLGKATVGELDGIRIKARTVSGEVFTADAFNGRVFTGNVYRTSDGGGQWSDDGWVMSDPDGKLLFNFPTDGSPASIDVDNINIRSASLAELETGDTSLTTGSTLTLESGQQRYPRAPEVRADWYPAASFDRPDVDGSYDWLGLAAWGEKWVRTVNVLGAEGDFLDSIDIYDEDGVHEKSISIDLNPRHGVAVIGDVAYVLGPDYVARPGAGKNWVHGFNLNTGARVSRWEFTDFAGSRNKFGIGVRGANLIVAGNNLNVSRRVHVVTYTPTTGQKVGETLTTNDWVAYTKDIEGVHIDGNKLWMSHREAVRRFTITGTTFTYDVEGAWENPNKNAVGFDMTRGWPFVVTESGGLFEGSVFEADTTIEATVTFRDTAGHETDSSPVALIGVGPRQSVAVSIPTRPNLSTRVYYREVGDDWQYYDVASAEVKRFWIDFIPGTREANPPTSNTFPNASPSVLRAAAGPFEVRGNGSGFWGPITVKADGTATGLVKAANGTVTIGAIVAANGGKWSTVITFPQGKFSAPPVVSHISENGRLVGSIEPGTLTATSVQINLFNWTTAGGGNGAKVFWTAIEGA